MLGLEYAKNIAYKIYGSASYYAGYNTSVSMPIPTPVLETRIQAVELNHENSLELLKKYLNIGYSRVKCFSIQDGAELYRLLRILKNNQCVEENVDERKAYKTLFKALDIANSLGAYSLDDSSIIDKVITFLSNEIEERSNPGIKLNKKIIICDDFLLRKRK